MLQLLQGNTFFSDVFAFNSLAVPNSSGHWLMAGLLTIFSPEIVSKITITICFALFTASVIWLRAATAGREDLEVVTAFAVAIAFNWLWMQGSYNYVLGLAGSTFTLGLFYKWREKLDAKYTALFALLFVFVYLGHLISFAMLVGSVLVLAAFAKENRRALTLVCIALIPCIPLLIAYKSVSASGEPFMPAWRSLTDATSVSAWAVQMLYADPFAIISRRSVPFYNGSSVYFFAFSPVIWIALAAIMMLAATLLNVRDSREKLRGRLPFILLSAACLGAALFGPDDFGLTNGSILRERMLIASLIFFVPVVDLKGHRRLKIAAHICLIFVVAFQTAALWDYSISSDAETREFINARQVIPEGASVASVVVLEDPLRFHAAPVAQSTNYLGVGRNVIVWDNYELGHYMFPIVTKSPSDKEFVFGLTTSNLFYLKDAKDNFDNKLNDLDAVLTSNHDRIDYIVVYGDRPRLSVVLGKWYDLHPIYQSGPVRVLARSSL